MSDWTTNERTKYLSDISGLIVMAKKHRQETEYAFSLNKHSQVKSCFTYPKAKLFAEGYSLGIKHGKL